MRWLHLYYEIEWSECTYCNFIHLHLHITILCNFAAGFYYDVLWLHLVINYWYLFFIVCFTVCFPHNTHTPKYVLPARFGILQSIDFRQFYSTIKIMLTRAHFYFLTEHLGTIKQNSRNNLTKFREWNLFCGKYQKILSLE